MCSCVHVSGKKIGESLRLTRQSLEQENRVEMDLRCHRLGLCHSCCGVLVGTGTAGDAPDEAEELVFELGGELGHGGLTGGGGLAAGSAGASEV
jgi:hypothetical protein